MTARQLAGRPLLAALQLWLDLVDADSEIDLLDDPDEWDEG